MRLISVVTALALVGCASSADPTSATRASCGPTPEPPLNHSKCFYAIGANGEHMPFIGTLQTTDPRGPNYVPPGCPCADYIDFPEPDGGWQR